MNEAPTPVLINLTSKTVKESFGLFFHGKDINPVDGRLLSYAIENPNVSSWDLQQAFQLAKASVSESLGRLVEGGYIEYQSDPGDKRAKRIVPTEKGLRFQKDIHEWITRFDEKALSGISPDEEETLRSLLMRVMTNLERRTQ